MLLQFSLISFMLLLFARWSTLIFCTFVCILCQTSSLEFVDNWINAVVIHLSKYAFLFAFFFLCVCNVTFTENCHSLEGLLISTSCWGSGLAQSNIARLADNQRLVLFSFDWSVSWNFGRFASHGSKASTVLVLFPPMLIEQKQGSI